LRDAVARFELIEPQFKPERLRAHTEGYSEANFREKFRQIVDREMSRPSGSRRPLAVPVGDTATIAAA
jgi:hypothetical protein